MGAGETVLGTAAAGGTGQFAVQLAKLAGCDRCLAGPACMRARCAVSICMGHLLFAAAHDYQTLKASEETLPVKGGDVQVIR